MTEVIAEEKTVADSKDRIWRESCLKLFLDVPSSREAFYDSFASSGCPLPEDFLDSENFSLALDEQDIPSILKQWAEASARDGSPLPIKELQKFLDSPDTLMKRRKGFVARTKSNSANSLARSIYSILWLGIPKIPGHSGEAKQLMNMIYRLSENGSSWSPAAKDWLKLYNWVIPEWEPPTYTSTSMEEFVSFNQTVLDQLNVTLEKAPESPELSLIGVSGKEKIVVSFACEENHKEERKAAGVVTAVKNRTLSCKCEAVSSSAVEEQINWYMDCAQNLTPSLTYSRQVTLAGQEHRPYDGGLSLNGTLQSLIEVNGGDHYGPRTNSEKALALFDRRVESDSEKALKALEAGLTLVAIDVRNLTRSNGRKLIQAVLDKIVAGEFAGLVTVGELTPGLKAINWTGNHHAF